MKKALHIAAAALTAVCANAATPVVPHLEMAEASHIEQLKAPVTATSELSAVRNAKAVSSSALRAVVAGDYSFNPFRRLPASFIWLNGLWSGDETSPVFMPIAVLPPNVPLTFTGVTAVRPADFDDWDAMSYSWEAYNSVLSSAELITSNEKAFTLSYENSAGYIYPTDLPVMTWKYGEATYSTDDDASEMYMGVVNTANEFVLNKAIETFTQELYPFSNDVKRITNIATLSMGNAPYYTDTQQSMVQVNNELQKEILAEEFEAATNEALDTAEVEAVGFYMDYLGAPYVLESLTVNAYYMSAKDGKIHFIVRKGTGSDNEIIYEQDVRVPATSGQNPVSGKFELAFESVDADGMNVSYITVDGPLIVEMETDADVFAPATVCYTEDSNAYYNFSCNVFSLVKLSGATETRYVRNEADDYVWGRTETTPGTIPLFFDVTVKAEYPILDVVGAAAGESELTLTSYREDGIYTVKLPEGENLAQFALTTTAEVSDEIYFDDIDLDSFVDFEVGQITRKVDGDLEQVVMPVLVEFSGEADDRYADLKASYLGKEVTLRVVQGNPVIAGIADVEAEGNGAVQYFDIQGRKLNAAPATGFFIQKQGSKVTKVIR